jgi:hypothetical protein
VTGPRALVTSHRKAQKSVGAISVKFLAYCVPYTAYITRASAAASGVGHCAVSLHEVCDVAHRKRCFGRLYNRFAGTAVAHASCERSAGVVPAAQQCSTVRSPESSCEDAAAEHGSLQPP